MSWLDEKLGDTPELRVEREQRQRDRTRQRTEREQELVDIRKRAYVEETAREKARQDVKRENGLRERGKDIEFIGKGVFNPYSKRR